MLARGRRRGWTVLGSGMALILLAGCGGRTSTLDADVYGALDGGSSGTGGGGGSGARAAGGKGGKGGKGGVDPSVSAAACSAYCEGFEVTCSSKLGNRDCTTACAAEIAISNDCQKRGIAALDCLAPHFAPRPGLTCAGAEAQGTSACSKELEAFGRCGTATPTPNRPVDTGPCSIDSSTSGAACFKVYSCERGSHLVKCTSSQCLCTLASGLTLTAPVAPNAAAACDEASAHCGLP